MIDIVKTISTVCKDIVAQVAHIDVTISETYEKENSHPSFDYSFIVGVTGFYKGSVTLSMQEDVAFFLAGAMTGKKSISELDSFTESALMELVNMGVGQAVCRLTDQGPVDITPPTFIRGTNLSLSSTGSQNSFVAVLEFSKGVIELNISLVEADK